MVPGMWLNEGGQSATGKLIDHIIESHPATPEIRKRLGNLHIQQYLSNILHDLAKRQNLKSIALLTKDLHVCPDFHGNRSPIADPSLKGNELEISGLSLSDDEESLALFVSCYRSGVVVRYCHILESSEVLATRKSNQLSYRGPLQNPIFTEAQATLCNFTSRMPDEVESVCWDLLFWGLVPPNILRMYSPTPMGGEGSVDTT
ncbi:hypothetical protein NQ317_011554 [Molorchus minor]|uniref:Carbohydrate kinase FGGY C-terminal domain-containing protein n=1 Tax=Molorchus minor TaxID=1323400 RepID=A0ABQ9JRL7_9CUCU|nr:hypothetical protein NQ317_011554 [Molorchus minor]